MMRVYQLKKRLLLIVGAFCALLLLFSSIAGVLPCVSADAETQETYEPKVMGSPFTVAASAKIDEKKPEATWWAANIPFADDNVYFIEPGDKLAYSVYVPEGYLNQVAQVNFTGHGSFTTYFNMGGANAWTMLAEGTDANGIQQIPAYDQNGIPFYRVQDGYAQSTMTQYMQNGWYERIFELPQESFGRTRQINLRFEFLTTYAQLQKFGVDTMHVFIKDARLIRENGDIHYLNVDRFGKEQYFQRNPFNIDNLVNFEMDVVEEDITATQIDCPEIPKTMKVGETLSFGTVKGKYFDGTEFTVNPDPEYNQTNNLSYVASIDGSEWHWGLNDFTPTKPGTYRVVIMQPKKADGGDVFNNVPAVIQRDIKVLGADEFALNEVSGFAGTGEIGKTLSIPEFPDYTGGVGKVTKTITIEGDYGYTATVTGNTFVPTCAGEFTLVYRAQDGAGNVAELKLPLTIRSASSVEKVLCINYYNIDPEIANKDTTSKRVMFSLWGENENLVLHKGDKLVYDMYSPNGLDGSASIGLVFSEQSVLDRVENSANLEPEQIDKYRYTGMYHYDIKDQNGIEAGRDGELSSTDFSQKWYHREIALPDEFAYLGDSVTIPMDGITVCGFTFMSDCWTSEPDEIEVYLRGLKIVRADGSSYDVMAAHNEPVYARVGYQRADGDGDDANQWGLSYRITEVADPFGSLISDLPSVTTVSALKEINIEQNFRVLDTSSNAIKQLKDMQYTASVTKNGTEIAITDGTAKITEPGIYEVSITLGEGETARVLSKTLYVYGEEGPAIAPVNYTSADLNGNVLTVRGAEAKTSVGTSVPVSVKVVTEAGEAVEAKAGSFTMEDGVVYHIIYSATDELGNTSYSVSVVSKDMLRESSTTVPLIVGIVMAVAGAGMIVAAALVGRKKNAKN